MRQPPPPPVTGPRPGPGRVGGAVRGLVGLLIALIALGVLLLGGAFALTGKRVVGSSMAPTLAEAQVVAANPLERTPDRFDVVLLRPAAGPAGDAELVKRVVGMPGDEIRIRSGPDGNPRVEIRPAGSTTWSVLVRPAGAPPWRSGATCCGPDGRLSERAVGRTVPPGRYFVLGDNPEESLDSRAFGFTAPGSVRAVIDARWSPFGPLPDPGYRLEPDGPRAGS